MGDSLLSFSELRRGKEEYLQVPLPHYQTPQDHPISELSPSLQKISQFIESFSHQEIKTGYRTKVV